MPSGLCLTPQGPQPVASSPPSSAPLGRPVISALNVQASSIPTPRQTAALATPQAWRCVHWSSSSCREVDLGGVPCRVRMCSDMEYQECRVLGIWIKVSNYVAGVRGRGTHRPWWERPLDLKTVGPMVTPHPKCGAQLRESRSWTLCSAEPRPEARG